MPTKIAPPPTLRIILTGFMGAGKSTLGPLLAAALDWRFVDVDDEMVRVEGISIAELFERHGEAAFRTREEETIAGLLGLERAVIALGGGALESESTRSQLLNSPGTHIVFLETPLDVALERCAQQAGGAVRPVLRDQGELAERFNRRLEHYRIAHQTLPTAGQSPADLVRTLVDHLSRMQAPQSSGGPTGSSVS